MPLFRRRRRKKETEGRATLMEIASNVYEDGDTKAELRAKMLAEIDDSAEDRPFLALLKRLLDVLLPFLLKLLSGAAAAILVLLLATPTLAGNHHSQQIVLQSGLAVSPFAIPIGVPVVTVAPHSYSMGFSGQAYAPQAAPQARVQSTKSAEDALVDRLVEKLAARLGLDVKPLGVDPNPLLTANCLNCHNAAKKSGGVDFSGEFTDDLRLRAVAALMLDDPAKRMPRGKQIDAATLGKLIQEVSKRPAKAEATPEAPK